MKILFIYEYGTESWSTPWSLMEEFKSRGHHVERQQLIDKQEFISDYEWDTIIVMDWKGISPLFNEYCKKFPFTFILRENGDTPQNYTNHLWCLDQYQALITPDWSSCEKYQKLGYSCEWINHFADTRIHYPVPAIVPGTAPVRSTRGPGGSQFLDTLSQIMPGKFLNKNGLTGREYGEFLANAKIVVQNSRHKEITRRIFEGMACGALVITDRLPEETDIDMLFEENEDIVYYDSLPECISKINYYLNNETERLRIANNGMENVMLQHTQKHVVDSILSLI